MVYVANEGRIAVSSLSPTFGRVHSLPTVLEARSLNKVDSLAESVYRESRNHPGRLRSVPAYLQACRSRNTHIMLRTRSTLKYIDVRQNSRSNASKRAILCR